jgi:hypothetical protein
MADYTFPHDIQFFNISVNGVDVTSLATQTEIFQDIFLPSWSATINILDSQNLATNLPITIGSYVEITIETNAVGICEEKKIYEFFVYKVPNKKFIKDNVYSYQLHLISKQFFIDQRKRVSLAFQNKSADEMVSKIVQEYLYSNIKVDQDPSKYSLVVPNRSPFVSVEWISRFAKTSDVGPDFIFFLSDTDEYTFRSVESIYKEDVKQKFKHLITQKREDSGSINPDTYINIEAFRHLTTMDSVDNFSMGVFGNTVIQHDIVSKKVAKKYYSYSEDNEEDRTYKPYNSPIFSGVESSNITISPIHKSSLIGTSIGENMNEWYSSRKSNIMKLETNRLLIDVPGHSCFWKLLGNMVEVEIPLNDYTSESNELDKYYKGKYLVLAIRHMIANDKYKIFLELNKKRLEEVI